MWWQKLLLSLIGTAFYDIFLPLSYAIYVLVFFFLVGTKKQLLKGLSGKFPAGQFCGILGPSGAGKTTLLHALSGYRTKGIEGTLKVNGVKRNEGQFRRRSCYITQEDQLPPFMTVEEAMIMAANLKLPQNTSNKVKTSTVYEILTHLGLQEQYSTKTDRLSGGQKKRMSIALELINNPPVFFLDEPTSGLDNVTMKQCLKLLRLLAREGRTIVCTIHQPPASLLGLFDQIYVVAKGLCIYQGHPGNLVPFLRTSGYECPTSYNPADYIIELADCEADAVPILCKAIENGKKTEMLTDPDHLAARRNKKDSLIPDYEWLKLNVSTLEDEKVSFPTSGWYQFWILLQRLMSQSLRNKKALLIQFFHYLTCGLLIGTVFYDNGNNGAMMFNHLKFCVGIVMFFSHTRLFIPVILFPTEVKIAKKEHFNRWYGLVPYYMATTIAGLPVHLTYNFVYISIVYFLSGLPRELWRFLMYVLISNAVSLSTDGMGYAVGSIFNEVNGSVIGPSITVPFLGLAIYGFDFAKQISTFMQIMMRTSPMRCGLVAFILVTFGFGRKPLHCDDMYCHFADPKVLTEYLDVTDNQIYIEMGALLGIIIFYRVVAFMSLKRRFAT